MEDDEAPGPGERLRNILIFVAGAVISIGWLTLQVLSTGAGCWFWAC